MMSEVVGFASLFLLVAAPAFLATALVNAQPKYWRMVTVVCMIVAFVGYLSTGIMLELRYLLVILGIDFAATVVVSRFPWIRESPDVTFVCSFLMSSIAFLMGGRLAFVLIPGIL